ncbi:MAG: HlyD family efflux transporter periplasmic adaptor subunit [Syntrophothermaceae bacterium]|jgi:putative membrane fusion protein
MKTQRRERLQKEKRNRVLVRLVIVLLAAALVVAVGWNVYRQIAGKVTGMMIGVEHVQEGCLEDRVRAEAVVIHQETLIPSPGRGRLENLVLEGERVRKGSRVGNFYLQNGQSTTISAPISGVVSYRPDGLEEMLAQLDIEHPRSVVFSYQSAVSEEQELSYQSGQPLLKMVNNLTPTVLVVRFPHHVLGEPLQVGQVIEEVIWDKSRLGRGKVAGLQSKDEQVVASLVLDSFCAELINQRRLEVDLIKKRYYGGLVPSQAIIEKDGHTGVFCLRQEKVFFKSAEVVVTRDEWAVVKGLDKGEYVVTTPELVHEGMVLDR